MIALLRLVRTSTGMVVLALLAALGCSNAGKTLARDASAEPMADAADDLPAETPDAPVDAAGDVPVDAPVDAAAQAPDLAQGKDMRPVDLDPATDGGTGGFDGAWDMQANPAVAFVPIVDDNIVFGDDFHEGRADGWQSADPGSGTSTDTDWSIVVGATGIVYCQVSLDASSWHLSSPVTSPLGDQIVEAIVRVDDFYAFTAMYMAAVFVRYDPQSDTGYLLALRGDGRAILRKRSHGTTASWDTGVDLGIVPGTWYTVHLQAIGNTVAGFVDGKFVGSRTESSPIASGTVALGAYGAALEVQRVIMAPAF